MANGTLKVSNIQTSSGSGTITIGQSGETITIPSGATQTGVGGKNTPYFEMSLSSNQTGLSDNTATKIQFDTSDLDSDSGVDVSTNYRYTVQSGDAGKYFLIATATGETTSSDDNKDTSVFIYKNGSSVAKTEFETSSSSDAYRIGKTVYTIQDLSAGDYIETFIQINSSSNANTNIAKQGCTMSGFRFIE